MWPRRRSATARSFRRPPFQRTLGQAGNLRGGMTENVDAAVTEAVAAPRRLGSMSWSWVGVAPFFLFALLFLILPTGYLLVGSFQDAAGNFTLANIGNLFTPSILSAYRISIEVSLASAITG